ncbi:hypothetical protein [Cysteiniphilum sp. 6C5]|uniref:hypothetical protein n=1 Tax=unclassified Cysteiniphilum TaxID=2610889 RepID=UPI003F86A6EF
MTKLRKLTLQKIGISTQQLCDIEHGRRPVTVQLAVRFAKALAMSQKTFVKLALQDMLKREGLHYKINLDGTA